MFWVNVPVGVYGTIWSYLRLRDNGERHRARIDWGAAFAVLETRVEAPMFQLSLFRIRAFTAGNLAGLPAAARQTLTGREFFPDLISGPSSTAWSSCAPRPLPPQPTPFPPQPTGTQPSGSADRKARGQAPGLPAGLARRLRRTGDQGRLPAGRLGGVPGAPGQ